MRYKAFKLITRGVVKQPWLIGLLALATCAAACPARKDEVDPRASAPDASSEASVAMATSPSSKTVSSSSTTSFTSAAPTPLPVPGFGDALVVLPKPGRRPLVVVTHGHGEAPEGICALFSRLVAARAWVLCLRGTLWPISQVHTYEGENALGEELDAAIAALVARYPDVDEADAIYAGFSMGATFGVPVLVARATRFSRVILVEGGITDWSAGRIAAFARAAKNGAAKNGHRVLFAVGRAVKVPQAEAIVRKMKSAGIAAQSVFGVDEAGAEYGHGWDGPVAAQIERALPWLLEGDVRYAQW